MVSQLECSKKQTNHELNAFSLFNHDLSLPCQSDEYKTDQCIFLIITYELNGEDCRGQSSKEPDQILNANFQFTAQVSSHIHLKNAFFLIAQY
jgi:hypothetical protein